MTTPASKRSLAARPRSGRNWRPLIILVCIVGLLGAGGSIFWVVRKKQIHNNYLALRDRAIASCKAGNYAGAIDDLIKYYGRYKDDPDALYYLAEARRRVELPDGSQLRAAAAIYSRLLNLEPDRDDVRREMMRLYSITGYNTEAQAAADRLLEKNPDDAAALAVKARALAMLRKPEEALGVLIGKRAGGKGAAIGLLGADLESQALLLELYRELKPKLDLPKDPQADPYREFRRKLDADPAIPTDIFAYAMAYLAAHSDDGRGALLMSMACQRIESFTSLQQNAILAFAAAHYPNEKIETVTPRSASVFFATRAAASAHAVDDLIDVRILVVQLERLGLPAASAVVLQKACDKLDDPGLRRALYRRLFEMGRFAEVRDRLAGLPLKYVVADADLLAFKAIALSRTGAQADAEALADSLAATAGEPYVQAWGEVLRQVLRARLSEPLKVVQAGQAAADAQRLSPYLRYYVGEAYARIGERDLAMEAIRDAAQACPLWPVPLMRLSQMFMAEGQPRAALAVARRAYDVLPQPSTMANLATFLGAEGLLKDEQLVNAIKAIQQQTPGEELTLPYYIVILAKSGKRAEAGEALRQALAAAPATTQPVAEGSRSLQYLRLAAISRELGLGLEDECFAAAEKRLGPTPEMALARALDLLSAGQGDKGAALLDDAMKKQGSGDVNWRLAWARYLEQSRDKRPAAAWIALADDPAARGNLDVQRLALVSPSVQGERAFLARTIDRLHQLTGDQAPGWKVARVRLLLQPGAAANPAELAEAVKLASEVVAVAPNQYEPHLLLAAAQEKNNDTLAAIGQLQAASKLRPESMGLLLDIARLYQSIRDRDHAAETLARVQADQLDLADRRRFAVLLDNQGEGTRAAALLQGDPGAATQPASGLVLAEGFRRQNQLDKAEAIYVDLLKTPTAPVILSAARFYAATNRAAEAEKTLARLDSLSLPAGVREILRAQYANSIGQSKQAVDEYRAAVKAAPASAAAWNGLIGQLLLTGRIDESLAAANDAAKALPPDKPLDNFRNNPDIIKSLATDAVLVPLLAAIPFSVESSDVALEAARTLANARKTGQLLAVTANQLRPIADRAPKLAALQVVLALACDGAGRTEEAVAVAQRALMANPRSPELAQLASQLSAAVADWPAALQAARQWRDMLPDPRAGDAMISEILLRSGDAAAAQKQIQPYLDAALAKLDSNPPVVLMYARILIQQGQADRAAEVLAPTLALSTQWRRAWAQLAVSQAGKPATAKAWLDRLSAVTPQAAIDEQLALAQDWHKLGKDAGDAACLEKSRTLMVQLGERAPKPVPVLFTLAFNDSQDGRAADAEKGYRRVLELQPDLPEAQNNLAMLILDRNGDLAEALSLATKAVAARPVADYYDTLAKVQSRSRAFDAAIASQKKSIELQPQKLDWRLNLAEIYQAAGRPAEANAVVSQIEAAIKEVKRVPSSVRDRVLRLKGIGSGPSTRPGG